MFFADSQALTWTFLDLVYRAMTWATRKGARLIAFLGGKSSTLTIEPPARDLPDLPLLVALGCYLALTGLA